MIFVISRLKDVSSDNMAPMFIFDVRLPSVISEFLRKSEKRILGNFTIYHKYSVHINTPTPLGWISMRPGLLTFGVKTYLGVVEEVAGGTISFPDIQGAFKVSAGKLTCLPTKYQVYSQEGLTSPMGQPYSP